MPLRRSPAATWNIAVFGMVALYLYVSKETIGLRPTTLFCP